MRNFVILFICLICTCGYTSCIRSHKAIHQEEMQTDSCYCVRDTAGKDSSALCLQDSYHGSNFLLFADTISEEGFSYLMNYTIVNKQGQIIYQDSDLVYTLDAVREIAYGEHILHLLIRVFDPISARDLQVLSFRNDFLINKVLLYGQCIIDMDNDGIIEIVGHEYTDAVCSCCDSCHYSPYEVYKLESIPTIDRMLSRKMDILRYGFHSDSIGYGDTILICNQLADSALIQKIGECDTMQL